MGRREDREAARQAFDKARLERDKLAGSGNWAGAQRAHKESSKIVRDFNRKGR